MENFSKKVLEKIKKEEIKPAPKWEFLLKKSVLWVMLGVTVVLGGLATAVVIFMLKANEWDVHQRLDGGFLRFLLESLPYFWLLVMLVFVGVALYNFKHTEHGYRYSLSSMLGIVVGVSALLGLVFFGTGLAEAVENEVLQKFPAYQRISHERFVERWSQPDHGLLAGEILNLKEGVMFLLDFDGKEWVVGWEEVPKPQVRHIHVGGVVKVFGEVEGEDGFIAEEIRPWERNFAEPRREKMRKMKENFLKRRSR